MKPRQPSSSHRFEGRCQLQQVAMSMIRDLEDVGDVRSDLCPTSGGGFFREREDRMSIESLKCKECGTAYELDASYVCENCFGPLEVAYDYSSLDAGRGEAADPGRLAGDLALRRLPPLRGPARRPAGAGPDAAGARRPAGRAARGRGGALDQERRRQPDPLLQGPGRRRRRRQGPGARLRDRRLRLDRQPRQRRRRPRRRRRARLLRLRPRRPRGAEAARDRRLRHQPGRRPRQLRRRQPALHRSSAETRPWAFVNVNLRPYYAEGSKTLAYETVEQLGWELPDRIVSPIASGSLFTKLGRGFQEWLDLGLVERRRSRSSTAPRPRAAARSRPPSPKAGTSASRRSRRRSPRAWRSATRPTAPTRSSSPAAPAAAIDSVTDDEIRDGIRLLAETTGIFTETAGGVTIGVLAKLAERGEIGRRRTGRRLHHRRGPEDARRHPRYVPDARDRPRPRELRGRVPPGGSRLDGSHREDPDPAARRDRRRSPRSRSPARPSARSLDAVFDAHGDLRERITQDGDLRRFVNVYVSGEDIRFQQGLETAIDDGAEVTILPAVAGG